MQIEITARIILAPEEYFEVADPHSGGPVLVDRLTTLARSGVTFYGHGARVLKNGKPSQVRRGCVNIKADDLPTSILEQISVALVPHAAPKPGAEAARQAALG